MTQALDTQDAAILATRQTRRDQIAGPRVGDFVNMKDGTLRRSAKKKGANDAIHIVSAFAAEQRLVLGQTKVDEKSNEACPRENGDYRHPQAIEYAEDRRCHLSERLS